MLFAGAIAVLFCAYEPGEPPSSDSEFMFEAAITIYRIVKDFRPSPILDDARYAGLGERSGSAGLAPG